MRSRVEKGDVLVWNLPYTIITKQGELEEEMVDSLNIEMDERNIKRSIKYYKYSVFPVKNGLSYQIYLNIVGERIGGDNQ